MRRCWPLFGSVFASGALVEVWSPLNNSLQSSTSVSVSLGVFVEDDASAYSVCLSLLEASGTYSTLTCRSVDFLSREQVNLELLPGRRRLRASLVKDNLIINEEESWFTIAGSTDIAAASTTNGWFAACPDAESESEARSQYFDAVYRTRFWTGRRPEVPASGPGSTRQAAANAIRAIERTVRDLRIELLLDAPCGDKSWVGGASLPSHTEYVGVDVTAASAASIVLDLVDTQKVYEKLSPIVAHRTTLVLCRHLLFHLPHSEGIQVIQNLKGTGARWLLTSTYLRAEDNERDFVFADGHKTNLLKSPYCLDDPLELYRDAHPDQYLALFDLHNLQMSCS